MGAPEAFDLVAIHFFRAGPTFGRAQHDHGPPGPLDLLSRGRTACFLLDSANLEHAVFQHFRHLRVHHVGVAAFDEMRSPSKTLEQHLQLILRYACQDGRVGDLVAVQMENRQHSPVAYRIEKLVGVPTGRQRPGLGFTIADRDGYDQIRVVKGGAKPVRNAVAELTAFMNGARRFRRAMAANAPGKRELLEKLLQTRPHPGSLSGYTSE